MKENINENYCDPETGVCRISSLEELSELGTNEGHDKVEIIYVGDPMCSWCWGISPALKNLRDHFAKNNIAFRIVTGGLQPGGGGKWDENQKNMLKHHWTQVTQRSGQPFGFNLFELENFDYDTESACRAVVSARPLVGHKELEFFEAIQRKFYVESQDPKEPVFYKSICQEFQIEFDKFLERFEDENTREETFMEFDLNRRWGVQGFPSVLLSKNNKLHYVTNGYSTFEIMKTRIENLLETTPEIKNTL